MKGAPSPNLFELDPQKVKQTERDFPASRGRCWWWRCLRWAEFIRNDAKKQKGLSIQFLPPKGVSEAERDLMQLAFEVFKQAERGAYNYELARRFLDEDLQQHDPGPWATMGDFWRDHMLAEFKPKEPRIFGELLPGGQLANAHTKFMAWPEAHGKQFGVNLEFDDDSLVKAFLKLVREARRVQGVTPSLRAPTEGKPPSWGQIEVVDKDLAGIPLDDLEGRRLGILREEGCSQHEIFRKAISARMLFAALQQRNILPN